MYLYLYHGWVSKCGEIAGMKSPTDPRTGHLGKRGGEGCSMRLEVTQVSN